MDGCRHIYVMQGSPRCSFVVQESRWSGEKDHGSDTCRAAFPVHWPHQPYDAVRLMGDARRLALIQPELAQPSAARLTTLKTSGSCNTPGRSNSSPTRSSRTYSFITPPTRRTGRRAGKE